MNVVLTEAALADLIEIGRYIEKDNPTRSAAFVDRLYDGCRRIGTMPYAYPLIPNHEAHGVRRRVLGSYLIFYRIANDSVEILHVLHGARDYEPIVFSQE